MKLKSIYAFLILKYLTVTYTYLSVDVNSYPHQFLTLLVTLCQNQTWNLSDIPTTIDDCTKVYFDTTWSAEIHLDPFR